MSKLEQSTQTGSITDPEKLADLKKSLKKKFESMSVDDADEKYFTDKLHHTLEKTPDEFIEKGIEDEIH